MQLFKESPHCSPKWLYSLHSHQQCKRVPFSPHPLQHLLLADFWITAIFTGVKSLLFNMLSRLVITFLSRSKLSHLVMSNSVIPWTVVRQAPLSMGFSRQEYWSGWPFPPPGDLPDPGIEPTPLVPSALAGGCFTTSAPWILTQSSPWKGLPLWLSW